MINRYRDMDDVPTILDATALQAVMCISRATTYNLLNSKDFPTLTIGKRKLVRKSDLLAWIDRHKNKIS
ncbi:MAG: helix-turn-helix domain-containing protein [Lutisporaceae bacterium]